MRACRHRKSFRRQGRRKKCLFGSRHNDQLHFINKYYTDYKLIRIGISGLSATDHYALGKCVAKAAETLGRRAVYIASGDLSHKLAPNGPYGFAQEGPIFDRTVEMLLKTGSFLGLMMMPDSICEAAGECGLRSFWIMSGALDKKALESEILSYEAPFGVGYAVAGFKVTGDDEKRAFDELFKYAEAERIAERQKNEDEYVRLARLALETYIRTGEFSDIPEDISPELLNMRAGAFAATPTIQKIRKYI
ncbi:MAG: hypothetical protein IJC39_02560 [Firmicutes bacterium]|nr:hypothetical protein [Bacillota bacterium]